RSHSGTVRSIDSRQALEGSSRSIRGCVRCNFEGRYATECTAHRELHKVCLCRKKYPHSQPALYMCPEVNATCWQEYHHYYLPKKLFNSSGRIMRKSESYLAHKVANEAKRDEAQPESSPAFGPSRQLEENFDRVSEGAELSNSERQAEIATIDDRSPSPSIA
ncbi:TPA: hypothetical protein N0F65_005254, partial [Lagenidium giganteum]